MGFTVMTAGASWASVRPPRARPAMTGPRFLFRYRGREECPPPAGAMRRPHKDAHNHHGNGAQREVDPGRMRHPDHTRFRVSLGVRGVIAFGDTDTIFVRGNRLGNTYKPAHRQGQRRHAERER
jgi:hypothetical protein